MAAAGLLPALCLFFLLPICPHAKTPDTLTPRGDMPQTAACALQTIRRAGFSLGSRPRQSGLNRFRWSTRDKRRLQARSGQRPQILQGFAVFAAYHYRREGRNPLSNAMSCLRCVQLSDLFALNLVEANLAATFGSYLAAVRSCMCRFALLIKKIMLLQAICLIIRDVSACLLSCLLNVLPS